MTNTLRISVSRLTTIASALAIMPLSAQVPAGDPPGRAGRLNTVAGAVAMLPAGDSVWIRAPHNYTVTGGDRLEVNGDGLAEVDIGSFTVRLARGTNVDVINLGDDLARIGLSRGTLRVSVYRLLPNEVIEIGTPSGAVRVRAIGQYRVSVSDAGTTRLVVDNGSAALVGSGDQLLRSGQALEVAADGASRAIQRPGLDDFDRWSANRDGRVIAASCGSWMSRDIPGCADLDEHGDWYRDDNYGAIWYPRVVDTSWEPYHYGHWADSRVYGRVWVDHAAWGFAPFHYGRWVRVHSRWAWVPGPIIVRPYYAPALVAWVGGPNWGIGISTGVRHWVPLGPYDLYVPRYHHTTYYVTQVNITNVRGYDGGRYDGGRNTGNYRPPYQAKDTRQPETRVAVRRGQEAPTQGAIPQNRDAGYRSTVGTSIDSRPRVAESRPRVVEGAPEQPTRVESRPPEQRTATARSEPRTATASPPPTTRSAPPTTRSAPPPPASSPPTGAITSRRRPPS